jgi:ankyrin repeat protein
MPTEATIVKACEAGDQAQIRRWGRRGVRVSTWLPFQIAVKNGDLDMMRSLVNELGADVNQGDDGGNCVTVLHIAAFHARNP